MEFWSEYLSSLLMGFLTTSELVAISAPLGIILGIALGASRVYGGIILGSFARGFSALFRGFPLIVTLFLVFFGLPEIGIYLPPVTSAILSFSLCSGAYISEYVRGAIMSIDQGQSLAAKAIGMTKLQEVLYIILPQAIRRAIYGISNEIVYMIQYSSLAFAIGVQEMYSVARTYNSLYFKSLEIFSLLAVIYLVLTALTTLFFKGLIRKLEIPSKAE